MTAKPKFLTVNIDAFTLPGLSFYRAGIANVMAWRLSRKQRVSWTLTPAETRAQTPGYRRISTQSSKFFAQSLDALAKITPLGRTALKNVEFYTVRKPKVA